MGANMSMKASTENLQNPQMKSLAMEEPSPNIATSTQPTQPDLDTDESTSSHTAEPGIEPEAVFIKEECVSSDEDIVDPPDDNTNVHYYPEFVQCELAPSDSDGSVLNFEDDSNNEVLNLSTKNHDNPEKISKRTGKKIRKPRRSESILQCDICQKEFLHKHSLTTHLAAHADIRNYECPVCKKKFVRKDYMIQHTKLHSIGTRNFECAVCKKSYKQKKYLKEHEKLHIDSEYYSCSICNKKFSRKDFLERHEKIHATSPYYECSICNIKFGRRRSKFLMHTKIHTGLKDFECSVCSKKFARKDKLKRHEKIHLKKNNCNMVPDTDENT